MIIKKILLLIVSILLFLSSITISYRFLMSEHYYRDANDLLVWSKFTEAYQKINKSLHYFYNNPEYLSLAGLICLHNKYYYHGIDYLKDSLAINPYQIGALVNLSILYRNVDDKESYLETLHKIITLDNKNIRGYANLVIFYVASYEQDKAYKYYNKLKYSVEKLAGRAGFNSFTSLVIEAARRMKDNDYIEKLKSQ